MKFAIYVRVSTLEQAEEGYSIEEQIDKLSKYCEVKNWDIFKIYKDGGFSGSTTDRPGLSSLITDSKRKKFQGVLVYKLDRLSRSQKDTLYLIEDVFTANDISFVSLNENFDTSSAFGKAMIGILAVFAQLEREQIKERMVMGKVGRAKSGKAMSWSKVPFGYIYENDTYVAHPIQAPIVKQIFDDYMSGISITKLKDKLNDEGHIGKEINWSYRTIRQTLANPIYAGINRYNGELFEGNHEGIITKDFFEKVQSELKVRQVAAYEKNNNPRPFQSKYMLSGIIRCGLCGASLSVGMQAKRKDGSRHRYYRCYSKSKKKNLTMTKDPNGCSSPNYSMDELEKHILSQIEQIRLNPELINALSANDSVVDFSSYNKRIDELDLSLEKIVNLFIDDAIPKDILEAKMKKIKQEKDSLEKKIDSLKIKRPILEPIEAKDILSKLTDNIWNLSYEDQKSIVMELISKILVYPDKLEIYWKFAINQ
ncbi:recombinase family protein [Enterococcus casseliflavus]|uniref:recombinase family protein n=1 Tax=Enterococcus casseliflavus TaxID=37734 RepID=UPI00115D8F72|nr:recombinase family protein [Enterococcus casseliflavus]